jgi:hypothetical protein
MTVAATVEGCGTGWPSEIPASAAANLAGANLTHANLAAAKLADTKRPDDMQVPEGWERVQARRVSPRHG